MYIVRFPFFLTAIASRSGSGSGRKSTVNFHSTFSRVVRFFFIHFMQLNKNGMRRSLLEYSKMTASQHINHSHGSQSSSHFIYVWRWSEAKTLHPIVPGERQASNSENCLFIGDLQQQREKFIKKIPHSWNVIVSGKWHASFHFQLLCSSINLQWTSTICSSAVRYFCCCKLGQSIILESNVSEKFKVFWDSATLHWAPTYLITDFINNMFRHHHRVSSCNAHSIFSWDPRQQNEKFCNNPKWFLLYLL